MMKPVVNTFFELLQVAIGNRQALSAVPSEKEWNILFELCKRHSLLGVAFVGIQKQKRQGGTEVTIPWDVYKQWLGIAMGIQQKNMKMNAECQKLSDKLSNDGFLSCIIKGQSNLVNYSCNGDSPYPNNLGMFRNAGDIDILMRSKENPKCISLPVHYCIEESRKHHKDVFVTYHHTDLYWRDSSGGKKTESVEAHHRASFLCSYIRNRRLQHWLEQNMPFGKCEAELGDHRFPIPPTSFNVVYQLLHIFKHLFESGIGLRQLMDYYFVLKAYNGSDMASKDEVMDTFRSFGMEKFVSVVMWVLQKVFAMPDEYLLCAPADENEGMYLLREIMIAGNFGHYDQRLKGDGGRGTISHSWVKTCHNFRLLKHYPEEVLAEPLFRLYHYFWRILRLWKYE